MRSLSQEQGGTGSPGRAYQPVGLHLRPLRPGGDHPAGQAGKPAALRIQGLQAAKTGSLRQGHEEDLRLGLRRLRPAEGAEFRAECANQPGGVPDEGIEYVISFSTSSQHVINTRQNSCSCSVIFATKSS